MKRLKDFMTGICGEDPRSTLWLTPTRIVWTRGDVQRAEQLLFPGPAQATLGTLDHRTACVMQNHAGGEKAALLIDFGREIHGRVRLVLAGVTDRVDLRLRLGESVSEAMAELGEKNATNDHAVRDQVMNLGFLCCAESGESGFRFARLDLLTENGSLGIQTVQGILIYLDVPYRGSFESSDPLVDRIWQTAAYTTHLNMQRYLWDGIKRDRLVWIGDMQTEVMTILSVFGSHEIVPRSMDLVREETPPDRWMNDIASYSMWWILLQYDWYLGTGDRVYLETQKTYLKELAGRLCAQVDAEGTDTLRRHFLDWPSSSNPEGSRAGVCALLWMALQRAAQLLDWLKEGETAELCRSAAQRMRRKTYDPAGCKPAGALLAVAGLADANRIHDELLAPGGAHGYSTFLGYYLLSAMALAGDSEGALEHMKQYWGGMLHMGATTFWEDFHLAWMENASPIDQLVPEGKRDIHGDFGDYCYRGFRHSLCHGWASGPVPFLMHRILGVQILDPGCRRIRIAPQLGGLQYARGIYPTPLGDLTVCHTMGRDGRIDTEVQAPEGIEVIR